MTLAFDESVTVHVSPAHAPPYVTKTLPLAAVAVSVTCDPPASVAVHVEPQLIPEGALVTAPAPAPHALTVSVCVVCASAATLMSPDNATTAANTELFID
jgi:hypothetical protein